MAGTIHLPFRIGQSLDVHAFSTDPARKLMLCGIEIPDTIGLEGHSDADVALHVLAESIMVAMGWGDLGTWFPPEDPSLKNIDSKNLLNQVLDKLADENMYTLAQANITIIAEKPKLAPFRAQMKASIYKQTGLSGDCFGLAFTTSENLGFLGRKEGMAAMGQVMLLSK